MSFDFQANPTYQVYEVSESQNQQEIKRLETAFVTKKQCATILKNAFSHANEKLKQANYQWEIAYLRQSDSQSDDSEDQIDPNREIMLKIKSFFNTEEPIDIFNLAMDTDRKFLKTEEEIVNELFNKVINYLKNKETEGLLTTEAGTQFDLTQVKELQFYFDNQHYLRINGLRIAYPLSNNQYTLMIASKDSVKGPQIRSYTHSTVELLKDNKHIVKMWDAFDLVREDRQERDGMYINLQRPLSISPEQLIHPDLKSEAQQYQEKYYVILRKEKDAISFIADKK